MEQLFCHLIGDYFLQTNLMAEYKKKYFWVALLHGFIYTLPFLIVTRSIPALLVIWLTHALIDGTNFVGKLNQLRNNDFTKHCLFYFEQLDGGIARKANVTLEDGYNKRPLFLRIWLTIIQDNALHLMINYYSILYL